MAIDKFDVADFDTALTDISEQINQGGLSTWVESCGIEMGEYTFAFHIDWRVSIVIRSSVREDGKSAGVGKDSIRLWMQHTQAGKVISKLPMNYVTRVAGWEERLAKYIGLLVSYRLKAGDCRECDHPMYVYRTKKPNEFDVRQLFASCFSCNGRKVFFWMENRKGEPMSTPEPYFIPDPSEKETGVEVASEVISTGDEAYDSSSTSDSTEEAVIKDPEPVGGNETELVGPAASSVDLLDELEADLYPDDIVKSQEEPDDPKDDLFDELEALDLMEEEETNLQADDLPDSSLLDKAHDPNPEQEQAITTPLESAIRVIAPPGAGKTFLLVRRIKYLVDQGIDIKSVAAVAFNVKMAETLRGRFLQLMPGDWDGRQHVDRNISTIHAMCYRMLKDSGDKRRIPERAYWKIKKLVQDFVIKCFPDVEDQPNHKEILGWIYTSKNQGIPEDDVSAFYHKAMEYKYASFMCEMHIVYTHFMKDNGWLMFGDMLYDVEMKLQNDPAFRNHWQQTYKYVIVDEGQDVNGQAMRILTTLAAPQDNFFIVGDPDQLLYRFTGATPEVNLFSGFDKRFPEGKTIMLKMNYRSTINIISRSCHLILHNYKDSGGPYDERFHKIVEPRPEAEIGTAMDYVLYDSQVLEAEMVVNSIVEQVALGIDPGQIFVGARTRAQLSFLEGDLIRKEIPYINTAGEVFWNSRHVGDVMAFLKLAYDNNDDKSFEKIYNIASKDFRHPFGEMKGQYCPHHYLGRKFLDACGKDYHKVASAIHGRRRWPWKFVMKAGSEDLVQFIDEISYELSLGDTSTALGYIVSQCYRDYLLHETGIESDADGGPFQDLAMLMHLAQSMESTREFIDYVDVAAQRVRDAANGSWAGKVILSTVHGLKGLERDVVYGIGLCEGTSYKNDEEQPYGLLPHTFSMREPPNRGVLPGSGPARIEDERCIAFVLISRAAEQVFLSGFKNGGADSILHPSRFVEEMGFEIKEDKEE